MGDLLINDYDYSKIFIRENRFDKAVYTNGTGDEVTLAVGTLLGRISASDKVTPLKSAAADGSNIPVGVVAKAVTVADGADATVNFCVGGDVVKGKIIFDGTDDFDTVVSGRTLGDRIAGDTLGIKAVPVDNLTGFDNQ
jgi:hypothetical protein